MDTYEHIIPLIKETQGTHHIPKRVVEHSRGRIFELLEREQLSELEPGQAPIWTGYLPCNTVR